jgi:hypothetical protein
MNPLSPDTMKLLSPTNRNLSPDGPGIVPISLPVVVERISVLPPPILARSVPLSLNVSGPLGAICFRPSRN